MKTTPPIAVVGGSLAGMATAARLAKLGHSVRLYEARQQLGGHWAAYLTGDGRMVDDAPAVLGFPAPWRDLFRKSGRPLEAELSRSGRELAPADAATVAFPDGTEIRWPADRGEQFAVVRDTFGQGPAQRWRTLLDGLDEVWQALRPLGLEAEVTGPRRLPRATRDRLLGGRRTVADLADHLDHPGLIALVRSMAYRQGSLPERTPAFAAVDLSVHRTFGRWVVRPSDPEHATADAGRSSVLAEALAERLLLRKVEVRLAARVVRVSATSGRVDGVATAAGLEEAAAVVWAADPWQAVAAAPAQTARDTRRALRRLRPAAAPRVAHFVTSTERVQERVELDGSGRPRVVYSRPSGSTAHDWQDWTATIPDPNRGVAWDGIRSWLRRPRVSTELPGLYLVGPWSAGGSSASAALLSAALAAAACNRQLTP